MTSFIEYVFLISKRLAIVRESQSKKCLKIRHINANRIRYSKSKNDGKFALTKNKDPQSPPNYKRQNGKETHRFTNCLDSEAAPEPPQNLRRIDLAKIVNLNKGSTSDRLDVLTPRFRLGDSKYFASKHSNQNYGPE